jgi:hypothetical protein
MSNCVLSIALYLRDGYSKSLAKGNIQVSLKASGKKAVQNPSGHYTFIGLPDGEYVVQVKSENYLDEEIGFNVNNERSVDGEIFDLIPAPSYPFFSSGETLVRGRVLDADDPVANADIYSSVFTSNLQRRIDPIIENGFTYHMASKTDSRGEFVFFFGPLVHDMIFREELPGILNPLIKGPEGSTLENKSKIPLQIKYLKNKNQEFQKKTSFDHVQLGIANTRHLTLES